VCVCVCVCVCACACACACLCVPACGFSILLGFICILKIAKDLFKEALGESSLCGPLWQMDFAT